MNVLVYSGPEVLQTSLNHALSTLRSILVPHYSVQTISLQTLKTQPWSAACALLVFPGCRDMFLSSSVSTIKSYVENGGAFLGLATGAHYSSRGLGQGILNVAATSISKDQLLRFYDQTTGTYIYPTFSNGGIESIARSVPIQVVAGERIEGIFENGTREFVGVEGGKNIKVLARYIEDGTEGAIAGLRCNVGNGTIILWSPSPECPLTEEPASSIFLSSSLSSQQIDLAEKQRRHLMQDTLAEIGLRLPSAEAQATSRPLPQFLTGHFLRPGIVSRITEAIGVPSPTSQLSVFKDANDTFHFHALSDSAALLEESRTPSETPADPSTWQPKHIIICPNGKLPDREQTPLFDLGLYYSALSAARTNGELPDTPEPWGMGEAMIYGEVVTSTQTMLDKNPRLLSTLPTPLVSLASYQLAGRGRGANVWLSPAGCLQFSLLLRVSLSSFPASKLVFVQYLFALAVAEACREDSILGQRGKRVRLKWPNDLYAIVGDGEKKKIGGILVNTSFSAGKIDIVIGCGVNVLNPPPITSLSQLLPPGGDHSLSMERTAAAIMAKFEGMWSVFLAKRGSFEPFMNLYLERWLHSDQLVTLTTTNPPTMARIAGITSDHGLLRTLPERSGWASGNERFIDLQPDGNSFDLMAGMIKAKS